MAIDSVPPGLNQDEASAGYDAWSLLHSGMDRNGHTWPVLLTAWGSGQNILYSYLSIPFIAVFGLNVTSLRLTAGLCGSFSLILFYGLLKRIKGNSFATLGMLVLALNPWHVMISRWALESNLLPFTLLLGVYCLVRTREQEWWLLGAASAFGLSLYAYGTAYVFLPVFLISASVIIMRAKQVSLRCYLYAFGVFILLAFPVTLCNIRNVLGLGEIKLLWMTLPALNETRQASTTIFGGPSVWENITAFVDMMWRQGDNLPFNSAGPFGILYGKIGLLFAVLGFVESIIRRICHRCDANEIWPFLAVGVSCLSMLFIDSNINRMNMLFLPLLYYQTMGLYVLGQRWFPPIFAGLVLAAGVMFAYFYFSEYADRLRYHFYEGLGEAISYAAEATEGTIWLTDDVNMPYIYVLFYEQIPPDEYLETVVYENPGEAFERVRSFSRWRFGSRVPEDDTLCILRNENTDAMNVIAEFGGFAVARNRGM